MAGVGLTPRRSVTAEDIHDLQRRARHAPRFRRAAQDLPQPHRVHGQRPELLLGFDHQAVLADCRVMVLGAGG